MRTVTVPLKCLDFLKPEVAEQDKTYTITHQRIKNRKLWPFIWNLITMSKSRSKQRGCFGAKLEVNHEMKAEASCLERHTPFLINGQARTFLAATNSKIDRPQN